MDTTKQQILNSIESELKRLYEKLAVSKSFELRETEIQFRAELYTCFFQGKIGGTFSVERMRRAAFNFAHPNEKKMLSLLGFKDKVTYKKAFAKGEVQVKTEILKNSESIEGRRQYIELSNLERIASSRRRRLRLFSEIDNISKVDRILHDCFEEMISYVINRAKADGMAWLVRQGELPKDRRIFEKSWDKWQDYVKRDVRKLPSIIETQEMNYDNTSIGQQQAIHPSDKGFEGTRDIVDLAPMAEKTNKFHDTTETKICNKRVETIPIAGRKACMERVRKHQPALPENADEKMLWMKEICEYKEIKYQESLVEDSFDDWQRRIRKYFFRYQLPHSEITVKVPVNEPGIWGISELELTIKDFLHGEKLYPSNPPNKQG
jgi:hypothetical protein